MVDEGTNCKSMSRGSPRRPTPRAKIQGDEWMNWWVGKLGNREMATLVKQLPLDLPTSCSG